MIFDSYVVSFAGMLWFHAPEYLVDVDMLADWSSLWADPYLLFHYSNPPEFGREPGINKLTAPSESVSAVEKGLKRAGLIPRSQFL